jgi:hypothetical protein
MPTCLSFSDRSCYLIRNTDMNDTRYTYWYHVQLQVNNWDFNIHPMFASTMGSHNKMHSGTNCDEDALSSANFLVCCEEPPKVLGGRFEERRDLVRSICRDGRVSRSHCWAAIRE